MMKYKFVMFTSRNQKKLFYEQINKNIVMSWELLLVWFIDELLEDPPTITIFTEKYFKYCVDCYHFSEDCIIGNADLIESRINLSFLDFNGYAKVNYRGGQNRAKTEDCDMVFRIEENQNIIIAFNANTYHVIETEQ